MGDDWEADDWEAEDFKPKLPSTGGGAAQFETAGEAILARATGPDDSKFAGEDEGADEEDESEAAKQPSQVRLGVAEHFVANRSLLGAAERARHPLSLRRRRLPKPTPTPKQNSPASPPRPKSTPTRSRWAPQTPLTTPP